MLFSWDKNKNKSNKAKHGFGFEKAKDVFSDKNKVTKQDTRHDYGEDRFNTIGMMDIGTVSVVHTPRKDSLGNDLTRIISARKANKKEKRWYQK